MPIFNILIDIIDMLIGPLTTVINIISIALNSCMEILSLIIGLITGGTIGYKIGIHNKIKQKQKAGNNSTQTQIGSINYGSNK